LAKYEFNYNLGKDNFTSQFYVTMVAIPEKKQKDKIAIFDQIWPSMAILWPNLSKCEFNYNLWRE